MKIRFLIVIFLIPLFLSVCSDKPTEPDTLDDGWIIASPESVGMNSARLNNLTSVIENNQLGPVSSLLILRDGKLVYEEYFRQMGKNSKHPIYSITKSFTSALIGIAIERQLINSENDIIWDYLSEYYPPQEMTVSKDSITIAHLLQMRSGFEWEELAIPYSHYDNSFNAMYRSDNLVEYVLDLPMEYSPGQSFEYNTGISMVLGQILSHQQEHYTEPFAVQELFTPLGITDYEWLQRHNNFVPTGTGLQLKPRDMARLGLLYLYDGIVDNDTIITTEWINKSWEPHTNFQSGGGYGYHWWLLNFTINGSSQQVPTAIGFGNQYVLVIDDLDMVIVSTAENYDENEEDSHIGEIVQDYIIRAVN